MKKLALCRSIVLCACLTVPVSGAIGQTNDCKSIADPAERLKCFDQPKDCKTISDTAERLKCFDAQPSGAPAAAAPAPEPAFSAQLLKAEPPIGQLPTGAKALIDDGTCGPGKVKQVVGGNVAAGQGRIRSCVPRP